MNQGLSRAVTGAVLLTQLGNSALAQQGVNITKWGNATLGSMSTYGISPGSVLVPGSNVFMTNANSNGPATGANSAPTVLATDQAGPCTAVLAINQATTTDLLTLTNKGHICSVLLISGTAQSISLVEGTGTLCTTGIQALMGGTSGTISLAANGGLAMAASLPWLRTKASADHLCLVQSSTGNVSGVITYMDHS